MAQEMTPSSAELDLTRLLHQSQKLSAKVTGDNSIPLVFRGFEQIEALSAKLAVSTGAVNNENRCTPRKRKNFSYSHTF